MKRGLWRLLTTLTVGAHIITATTPAQAETVKEWQFEITPYLLAAGMEGTVGVRGVSTDVDVSFGDIWDHLDAGFMGLFTARKGPWMFGLEGVYMKLADAPSKSATGAFGQVTVNGALDVTNALSIYQGSVGYRLRDDKTKLDIIGALRYTELDVEADVEIATTPPVEFLGGAASADGSASWTDTVIGILVLHPVSDKVSLMGYADIGAGGSDLTYQLMGGANWQFAKTFSAKAGYRYMDWDYENNGTVWDMAASGPYLGLGIQF